MRTDNATFGKLRAVCLCVIVVGLIVLIITSQYDQTPVHRDCHLECEGLTAAKEKNVTLDLLAASPPWDYNWDLKAQGAGSPPRGTGERILFLVRHGKYDMKTGKLTELGEQQAAMTGQRLKAMNLTYDSIVHSTLERADQTAHIIHSYISTVPIRGDDMLVEGGPIPPNPTVSYWKLPERDYFIDGPRMEAAFRKYFHRLDSSDNRNIYQILVGHGNIFRFFTLRALQLSKDAWMRVFIAHASITQLNIRADGTVAMSLFGDAGYMPHEKVTY